MVASGEADIALAPVSELVNLPRVEFVSPLPDDVQLVQVFTAAIVKGSNQVEDAKRLIAFLSSSQVAPAIRKTAWSRGEVTKRIKGELDSLSLRRPSQ